MTRTKFAWLYTLTAILLAATAHGQIPQAAPEELGFDAERLALIEPEIARAIEEQRMPGCVLAIGRHGKLAWLKAYGNKRLQPEQEPMTVDTVFDMASITKPVATGTSIMLLVERGKLRLRDKVTEYFPEFAPHGKDAITIHHLLMHTSGLIADNALSDYLDGHAKAWQRICDLQLRGQPGERFIYSDVGFIVLGELVRKITGQDVHQYSQEHLFAPLRMAETGYLPGEALRHRAAPTEQRDGAWIQGEVHDPRAYALGGVAGHAGLFSTASDLAIYAQMMLQGGELAGQRVLGPATVAAMTAPQTVPGGLRGLGWDKRSGFSSNRGETFSPSAFGHGGFTGTVLWIDPQLDLFVIFLSNRVHPNGKGLVNPLAGRLGTMIAAAITDIPASRPASSAAADGSFLHPVRTGLDVLREQNFESLRGRRVGLITNHTGLASDGTSTIQLLRNAPGVELVALFSPEHGIEGKLDVPKISDTVDPLSGLKVHSLYGESRKPSADSLQDIDTLVFDIQDIGARFYTYVSTMGMAMEAAGEHGKRFVVLDRPNPINGVQVAGPVLDAGRESFVGYHRVPVRHGMTIGELAGMIREERGMKVELEVIRMRGWHRGDYFDATTLPWVNPSPNMRSLNAALLYPGIGLLETTNLSVGRGTDTPFELFGAPWIDSVALARTLNEAGLPGIRFTPIWFTPSATVFKGERCGGCRLTITSRGDLDPLQVGWTIARALRVGYPDTWQVDRYDRLLGNQGVLDAVRAAAPVETIVSGYDEGLREFLERRKRFLLY